jgi:flagellar basal-body rod protein FlgB
MLGAAMQAAAVRNTVISNNIANADVPGFKKSAVDFEDSFRAALDAAERPGQRLDAYGIDGNAMDIRDLRVRVRPTLESFQYRVDKNNVDMETEMMDLYRNSVKYDALAGAVIGNSKRLNAVISGK